MFDASVQKLLKDKLPVPPLIVIEASLKRDIDDVLAGVLPKAKWAVADDPNTRSALGDLVYKAVKKHGAAHVTFEAPPAATDAAVDCVRRQSADCDALIAVGAGTLNDICKYAAALDDKPYVIFPTAASMNGYLSASASISFQGYKKTCAASMPLAVFCDMSVIAAAPVRLNKSGLGDSLARPTAQADWLLSHLLLNTPYDETPFDLLKPYEPQLFDAARGVGHNDKDIIALLMKVLLLSGLGMTIAGGSYPASQAEHMIAHAMGMLRRHPGAGRDPGTLHGEEIGVTTLYMAALQETLLRGKPKLRTENFPEEKINNMFGDKVMQEAKKAFAVKMSALSRLRERGGQTSDKKVGRGEGNTSPSPGSAAPRHPLPHAVEGISDWPSIAARIEKITLPPARLRTVLEAAGLPMPIEALGWKRKDYDEVAGVARYLRERFTFLDLSS